MTLPRLINLTAACLGAVALLAPATARADAGVAAQAQQSTLVNQDLSPGTPARAEARGSLLGTQDWPLSTQYSALSTLSQDSALSTQHSIRDLPALPGSDALFLTAMLSAGVWQALRKARVSHWGHLPDWYHLDAPHQIGHRIVFDPAVGLEPAPACLVIVPPAPQAPQQALATPRELPSRCALQHFLCLDSPRGPPCP